MVAYVTFDKNMTLVVFDRRKIVKITGIRQKIEIDDADIIVFFEHVKYEVRSNKSGTTGHKIVFHFLLLCFVEATCGRPFLMRCVKITSPLRARVVGDADPYT